MSCLNKSFVVNKVKRLGETPLVKASGVGGGGGVSVGVGLACGRCAMWYTDYKQLLEHLYWRHGTEGSRCRTCGLKAWRYAPHVCHVLPINDADADADSFDQAGPGPRHERESDYCFCGKYVEEAPMIGCDGPQCSLQWYHFKCVGIVSPPAGDWLCPQCDQLDNLKRMTKSP